MTLEEFSNLFDVLVDSYRRFKDFDSKLELDSVDFNEYEKSVFLTKSLEELVIELYNGKNIFGDSFEKTEETRRNLSTLVVTETLESINYRGGLSECSKFFKLSDDLLFITYEAFKIQEPTNKCMNGKTIEIIPVSQDEFHRIINNPFKGVSSRRALRLDIEHNIVEIISKYNGLYLIRYLRKPTPIILIDLPDDLTICGQNKASECELNKALHNSILDRAVKLALNSKGYNINKL